MIKRVLIGLAIVAAIGANLYAPLRLSELHIVISAEPIFSIGPLVVTNSILATWVVMALLVIACLIVRRNMVAVPRARSVQNIVQMLYEGLLSYLEGFAGPLARKYYGIALSFFISILVLNLFSLFPGFGSLGIWHTAGETKEFVPLLRGATADLNTTVALAILSVLSAQVFGIRMQGALTYLSRFIRIGAFVQFFKQLGTGKVQIGLLFTGILDAFVGLLEIFEELTKVVSFSFRLFGNMFGGEVLLLVMAFILPYVVSLPFIGLEIMSGFVQSIIFTILSTAFAVRAASGHG
ncbi:MAG: F0F1 ATP synthase subunit A [Anaerolineae bacterium]|jgi:F-type H+-transporting ATPase subunit a|nr:F0F1 ATP synthase subunit A [Chloroflexota bacterium]